MVKISVASMRRKDLKRKDAADMVDPMEDACRSVLKRFKEKRTKILKQSLSKLKKIPDAEQCLRQAVLIRNTFIRAKDLSPKQFERQLLTQGIRCVDEMDTTIIDHTRTTFIDFGADNSNTSTTDLQKSHQMLTAEELDNNNSSQTKDLNASLIENTRQLVAVS